MSMLFYIILLVQICYISTGMIAENIAVQDKLIIRYQNHSVIDITAGLTSYNRTAKTMYVNFLVKRQISENAKSIIGVYKFSDNTWKRWAIQFAVNVKARLEDNELVIVRDIIRKYCHPPLPALPDVNVTYHINGYFPDPNLIPKFLSQGKWRADITFVDKDITFGTIEYYFDIKPKIG